MFYKIMNEDYKTGNIPILWDGNTAKRVVVEIQKLYK